MRTLYLPAEHTHDDIALAGELAELLDSAELFVVAFGEEGYEAPSIAAEIELVPEPRAIATRRPGGLLRALVALVRGRRRAAAPAFAPVAPAPFDFAA